MKKPEAIFRRRVPFSLISASGLHVFALALLLKLLLRGLPIPDLIKLTSLSLVLILFAIATGFQPATTRAVVISILVLLPYLFRREPDPISALSLAAIFLLVLNPALVFQVGFQLSTLAALFALCISSQLRYRFSKESQWGKVKAVIYFSLTMFALLAPLQAYYFGTLSLVQWPITLLLFPIAPLQTLFLLMAHATSFISAPVSDGLLFCGNEIGRMVVEALKFVASEGVRGIDVPSFSGYFLLPFYVAVAVLWKPSLRPIT